MKKCIKRNICEKIADYFEMNVYHKSTRNRSLLCKVPKVRTDFVKQGFLLWFILVLP